jgi:hypothetical protein
MRCDLRSTTTPARTLTHAQLARDVECRARTNGRGGNAGLTGAVAVVGARLPLHGRAGSAMSSGRCTTQSLHGAAVLTTTCGSSAPSILATRASCNGNKRTCSQTHTLEARRKRVQLVALECTSRATCQVRAQVRT